MKSGVSPPLVETLCIAQYGLRNFLFLVCGNKNFYKMLIIIITLSCRRLDKKEEEIMEEEEQPKGNRRRKKQDTHQTDEEDDLDGFSDMDSDCDSEDTKK